jgi:acyl-CoA dehydrogenase
LDQIFDFMVRDLSGFALKLYCQPTTSTTQMEFCQQLIRRPQVNPDRFKRVWLDQVFALREEYEMNP